METRSLKRLRPPRVGGDGGARGAGDGERVAHRRAAVRLLELAQEAQQLTQQPALEDEVHGLHVELQRRHHKAVAEVLQHLRLRHQPQRQHRLAVLTRLC